MRLESEPKPAEWRAASRLFVLVGAAALVFVTGCGGALAGDWHMVKAIPSREILAIDDVHFARDGSFAATVTIEGRTAREKGTYAFNGFKLTMRPQAGGQRRYDAVLKGRTIEIIDDDRKVILKKVKKSEDAPEGKEAKEGKEK